MRKAHSLKLSNKISLIGLIIALLTLIFTAYPLFSPSSKKEGQKITNNSGNVINNNSGSVRIEN